MGDWLSLPLVAELAGLNHHRAVERAVGRCLAGGQWHGANLVVRKRHGRGGRGGWRFEIRSDSLPTLLRIEWTARQSRLRGKRSRTPEAAAVQELKHTLIAPALAHPKNSPERAAAIRQIASTPYYHPTKGRQPPPPERTIHNWIKDTEEGDADLLTPKERRDKGSAKAIVTMRWDRAVPFAAEVKREIAEKLRQHLTNLWGNGAPYSMVRRLGGEYLAELTVAEGHDPGQDVLDAICELPKNLVESVREFRDVHEYRTHRKAWNDRRPRLNLSPRGLVPMQIVMGDVHHSDRYLRRPNGTLATPKMIGWLDLATQRFRCDFVLCEPSTGIRNEDLIDSFIGMVLDDEWGMPANLYLDNGSEYGFADLVHDPMKLAGLDASLFDRKSPVARAIPNEPATKGMIEGSFKIIEQYMAALPGYLGGNRMASHSPHLNGTPVPYDGSFDDFAREADGIVQYYTPAGSAGS